ncbi:odorant receptor 82a-like [Linepithema humile]|uniref:odorant receptor 82a-like n=1 Tax=Linepithema humile TaxID=83485 RepID=UPI00351DD8CD
MRIDHPSNRLVGNVLFTLFLDMASKRSNYKDFVWAIQLIRYSFKMTGLWPENHEVTNKNNFVSNIQASFIFIMIILVLIIPLIWSLVRVWSDMILMIENLQVTLPFIISCLKFVIMRWKRSAILLIVNMMAKDWMYLSVDAEKFVMIKQVQIARLFAICGYSFGTFGFIILTVLPSFGLHFRLLTNLTDSGRVFPIQVYYFFDTDQSPQFELTLAAQFISIFFVALIYMSVDAFFILTIFHMCSQLKNFRYRLLNLVLDNDFNDALRYIVETHLRLIRFANNMEYIFSLSALALLLYFGVVFCLYGFLFVIIISSNETSYILFSRMSFTICGATALLVQTFFYCSGGELVAKECEAVYRALCDLEWYTLEPSESRALILITIRASKSFSITAGKIFPLSMATFCNVLKTSVGYISFLLAKRS